MKDAREDSQPSKVDTDEERQTELDSERMADEHAMTPQQEDHRELEAVQAPGPIHGQIVRFIPPAAPKYIDSTRLFVAPWPPVLSAAEPLWRPWDPLWSQRPIGPFPPGTDPYRFGRNWNHDGTE
jgi:hypothetical protein